MEKEKEKEKEEEEKSPICVRAKVIGPFKPLPKKRKKKNNHETRPDTRQSSRGRLGKSSNAKTARNSKM